MRDGLDLSVEIEAICVKMGIEHNATQAIRIYPTRIVAEVLKRNDKGSFYLNADGRAATEQHEREVARS